MGRVIPGTPCIIRDFDEKSRYSELIAGLARVVAPRAPHHVPLPGNRRQRTFFYDEDYEAYIGLMAEWCCHSSGAVWAYCLIPNYMHSIAVPMYSFQRTSVYRMRQTLSLVYKETEGADEGFQPSAGPSHGAGEPMQNETPP